MGQGTRIRLYGKPGCGQCDKAKEKLKSLGLAWEFVDVTDWMISKGSDTWRTKRSDTVDFLAAYNLYYPMPLPLFRFNDDDYLGYTDGLKKAKEVAKAAKPQLRVKEQGAVNTMPVLEDIAAVA